MTAFRYPDDNHYHDGSRGYGQQLLGFDPKTELFYLAAFLNRNWGGWSNRWSLTKRPSISMTFTNKQRKDLEKHAKKQKNKKRGTALRRMAKLCQGGRERLKARIIKWREMDDETWGHVRGPVSFYLVMFAHPRHNGYAEHSYAMQVCGEGGNHHKWYWRHSRLDAKRHFARYGASPVKTWGEVKKLLQKQTVLEGSIDREDRTG